jgi:hypothetical protein
MFADLYRRTTQSKGKYLKPENFAPEIPEWVMENAVYLYE